MQVQQQDLIRFNSMLQFVQISLVLQYKIESFVYFCSYVQVYRCLSCDYLFGNLSDMKRHLKVRHHVQVEDIRAFEESETSAANIIPSENSGQHMQVREYSKYQNMHGFPQIFGCDSPWNFAQSYMYMKAVCILVRKIILFSTTSTTLEYTVTRISCIVLCVCN